MLLALIFFVILFFHQNYSLKLDQNYQVASWDDSRKLCDLAGESDVCSSTSGLCNIKLSVENVSHIFSNPLWINGFVTKPPWIYQIGCTIVTDYLLPSHITGVFKLNTDQTINDCVTACGNSSSYGLSDSLCHCLLDLSRTKSNLSNCHSSCQKSSTKPCKETTGNTGIIYMTEYKQYTGNLIKQVSYSPWYSCTATNTSSKVIKTEDCRKNLPFICTDQSGFNIHNTLVTWYAANEHCKNEGKLLINGTSFSSDIPSNRYFWTGIHRPLKWTWDINEDVPNYDVVDCLVLNKDENGLELQTRNCSFDGLSGLCADIQTGNRTFNFSKTYTNNREDKHITNVNNNTSSVYIGIAIGAVVFCIALIVGAVFARRRFKINKNSRLLPVKNGAKNQTEIEIDDSIHLRNEGFEVNRELGATLAQAKARQERADSIFKTEDWGPVGKYSARMQEILDSRAHQHFHQAMECKEQKDYQGTIVKINKAMSLRPDDPIYFMERAEAFIQLCDFQSAILNYKKACLLDPDNDDYYSRLGFLYYFQGQTLFDQRLYPEALESFSRAAEMKPNNVGYHIRSITCLAALQRHGECLALVNKRLETESNNPDLYIMRARLHEMFRNTTLSYYDIKDALALNEDHSEAKVMMENLREQAQDNKRQAMQLNLVGKHREGLQKISVAIETDPAIPEFHVIRGCLHRKLSDFNSAIDDFLLALDKCDHDEESSVYVDSQRQLLLTYNDFAVECFTKGYYEEAIILLNKAIKGEKREKGLYVNRGDCFFRQNDLNFALQDYTQASELDPNDMSIKSRMSVIHNEYGVTAYQDKNYSEAETKFTLAIQSNPKVGQYYISRSRARYMMENMNGARQDLIMGLLLDPTNEDVISILSRLFPGKSVSDVINSRFADAAKVALTNMMRPPRPTTTYQSQMDLDDSGETDAATAQSTVKASAKSHVSKAETEISAVDEKLWKPGGCFPDLKACMMEYEFNVKLVAEKNQVKDELRGALHDRKTLKYAGARVGPMPPPMEKPHYGGLKFQRERRIKSPTLLGKKQGYNWKKFSMGIGLADTSDG